jgi:hypothetical protein
LGEFNQRTIRIWLARVLEPCGSRAFYTLLAPEWQRIPLINEIVAGAKIEEHKYTKAVRDVRYYVGANLCRLATYGPIYYGLWQKPYVLSLIMMGTLTFFHFMSMFTEFYKGLVLWTAWDRNQIGEDENQMKMPDPQPPKTRGFWAPYSIESKEGYVRIGMEWFRKRVVLFVDSLSGGPATERSSRKGLYNFVDDTIAAEKVHLVGAVLGALFVLPFFTEGPHWIGVYGLFVIGLDMYLALLQRYHRTRVWAALRLERGN